MPDDLRAAIGKRRDKFSLKTRDPAEAKILHAHALGELEQRWANLRAPPKPFSERKAHELVAPAYEWWVNLHKDNPSEQAVWKTKFFDVLWTVHDHEKYNHLPLIEQSKHWEEEGYFDANTVEHFCRDRVDELLPHRGLRADPRRMES